MSGEGERRRVQVGGRLIRLVVDKSMKEGVISGVDVHAASFRPNP